MAQGKVKWFNSEKGYGFIEPDEGGRDVFLHKSALDSARIEVSEGSVVEYEVLRDTKKGKTHAGNLRLISA